MRKRIIKKSLSIRICRECFKEKSNNGHPYCDGCCRKIDKRNKDLNDTLYYLGI